VEGRDNLPLRFTHRVRLRFTHRVRTMIRLHHTACWTTPSTPLASGHTASRVIARMAAGSTHNAWPLARRSGGGLASHEPAAVETTQGQTDGFFSQLLYTGHLPEVACV
jgi:hypothetical protein